MVSSHKLNYSMHFCIVSNYDNLTKQTTPIYLMSYTTAYLHWDM